MTPPAANGLPQDLDRLRRQVARLRRAVFGRPDPAGGPALLRQLVEAEAALDALEPQPAVPAAPVPESAANVPGGRGVFLGPETTGLNATTAVHLDPIPTGVYHLLDPEKDPLLTVVVENFDLDNQTRRVCVKAFLEGLSAETVLTRE